MKLKLIPAGYLVILVCLAQFFPQCMQAQSVPSALAELQESSLLNYQLFLDKGRVSSGLNYYNVGGKIEILGDINGDGYDDWSVAVIMGVDYESNENTTGAIHIYLGGPQERQSETPADIVIYGKDLDDHIGSFAHKAGDVNADGFDDILIRSITGWHLLYGGNPFDKDSDLFLEKLDIHEGSPSFAYYAGDVNNDGYDDITMGVPTYVTSQDTMHAYLYYGGDPMDNVPDKIFQGGWFNTGAQTGAANLNLPRAAGDMNNDGYDDIMITSSYGIELHLGADNMDTKTDVLFNEFLGGGIGTGPLKTAAGDVNNDGYDDIFMIANVANTKAILYLGGETIDAVPDLEIPGFADYIYYGISSTALGDINKDGFDDIMLGTSTGWELDTGKVRIFYGGDPMDSIADVKINGQEINQTFGYSIRGNADFNGDGFNDFLVGNNGATYTIQKHDDAGDISLFYGADVIDSLPSAVFSGMDDGEAFGFSTAFAGDVNKDGYVDILVGAPNFTMPGNPRYRGRAYLYLGGETMDHTPDKIFTSENTVLDMLFGKNVMAAGDLNGDQYDDIAIEENGKLHIFLGASLMDTIPDYSINFDHNLSSFTPLGDINNDGYDDFLFGRLNQGVGGTVWLYLGADQIFAGSAVAFQGSTGENLGRQCAAAGDLNGDGFNDFVISAPGVNTENRHEGAVYIFFGKEEPGNVPDITINGTMQDQYLGGYPIAGGQDLNGDGFDDLVMGERFYNLTPAGDEGRLLVFLGGTQMDSTATMTITGVDTGDQLGKNVQMIPDINGDGFDEILANKGYLLGGNTETSVIYFGGDPPDTIPDITMGYIFDQQDMDGYLDENGPFTLMMIGDYSYYGAGPDAGRVHLFSTETVEIIFALEVSKNTLSLDYIADASGSFDITSNTSWSITSDADWLNIIPVLGMENASVSVSTTSENPSTSQARSATLTITGEGVDNKMVNVTQAAAPVSVDMNRSFIQNFYPNPITSEAKVHYFQAEEGEMEWVIMNALGQHFTHSSTEIRKAGYHTLNIQPEGLAPGCYVFQLRTPSSVQNIKFMVSE